MAYLIDGTTSIPTVGQLEWGATLNTVLTTLDERDTYSSGAGNFQSANIQFFYLGADGSGITTTATNPYGVSPNLTLNNLYLFEYYLRLNNSSTGAITLGWASTAATQFQAEVVVSLATGAGSSTAITGFNMYDSTANAAITGGNTAAIQIIRIRGMVLKGTATALFPLQVSVASGTITPKAGSWFKYSRIGLSTGGTTSITFGDIS